MANFRLTVQGPGTGPSILRAYRDAADGITVHRVTGLYAFATSGGAKLLVTALRDKLQNWASIRKRWVISIDGGITSPGALQYLLSQRKSEVRVPDAEQVLARQLRPVHRFHPKTMVFEQLDAQSAFEPAAIVLGSANLTCSGLCFGHEHVGTVALGAPRAGAALVASIRQEAMALEAMISSATRIDLGFVERYRAARSAVQPPEGEDDERARLIDQEHVELRIDMAAALAASSNLWVQIAYVVPNRGRREEGNQIDLQKGTRVFFGFPNRALPRNSPIGSVRIVYGSHSATRNLRFGNNSMDKLDLPIPQREGPPSYRDQTLLFCRQPDGSFRLTLGTPAEIRSWTSRSHAQRTLFQMRGGRTFGVFS